MSELRHSVQREIGPAENQSDAFWCGADPGGQQRCRDCQRPVLPFITAGAAVNRKAPTTADQNRNGLLLDAKKAEIMSLAHHSV